MIKNHGLARFLFLSGVVVFSVIGTSLVLHALAGPQQVTEYKMHLIVGDRIGFDLNREVITFGMVTPTGTATRHIDISNRGYTSRVRITASGDLADWIVASDNNFVLQPYENKIMDITVAVPADAELDDYTGTLKISFIRGTP